MKIVTDPEKAEGLTIADITKGLHRNHYEAFKFTFTDGSFMVITGGGYDGYGDFIQIEDNPKFTE